MQPKAFLHAISSQSNFVVFADVYFKGWYLNRLASHFTLPLDRYAVLVQGQPAMSSSDFEDLKAPLFRLFGKIAPKNSWTFLLLPLWREAVGPLASRTELKAFQSGTLHVEVDPVFLDDLKRAETLVLHRLNAQLDPFHTVRHLELTAAPGCAVPKFAYMRSRRA